MSDAASSSGRSIAVLGAGVTGLAAAHRLARLGFAVRVFECSARIGGAVQSESSGDWLSEGGPNSMLAGDVDVAALLQEIGLETQKIPANPAARNRFLVRGGRMMAAPASPGSFLGSELLSTGTKLRLLAELFQRPHVRVADVSVEEFTRSHFGQELVDYALNPFVAGTSAGDPKRLSTRHAFPQLWELEQKHGSLIRGQIAVAKARKTTGQRKPESGIFSFRDGLASIPRALAARLRAGSLHLNAQIEAVLPGPRWSIVWRDAVSGTTRTEPFDAIASGLPAPALASLRFGPLGERPLASLETIEHPPVSSLFLGYRREEVAHPLDGFGVLAPEIERRSVLGILFSSSLFAGRAPEGHVALTVIAGGARQPDLARLPTDQLMAAIDRDLRELLGVNGAPVFVRHTFWPRAIPQYNLGYERHLETMSTVERTHAGFFIGGQARDGISLPACLAAGEKLARRVATFAGIAR
jgi:oxygen-dependent protoporphyrinogen oxidase